MPFRSGDPLTRPHGPGLTDTGRVIACSTAVFFLGAGVIHVSAAADHENLPVMMAGFLAVAVLQAAFGALLLWRRPGRFLIAAGLALMCGSIGLWLISRTVGLPFLSGGHMEPIGFKDGVTVLFELAGIPGLLLLASRDLQRVVLPSPRLGERAIAGVGAAVFVLFVPALVLGGGEHHSAAELAAMGGHAHGDGDEHGDELASAAGAEDHGHGGEANSGRESGHRDHATADSSATDGHELAAAGEGGGSGHGGAGHVEDAEEPAGGHEPGGTSPHSEDEHEPAPGGGHGGGDAGEGGHPDADHPAEDHAGDHGDAGGGDEGGEGGGLPGPDDPGGMYWGEHSIDYEPARAPSDGDPGRGPAFVYRSPPDPSQGIGHHSDAPCQPTPEEEAAADRLYRQTAAVLTRYDNAPQLAIADGFTYIFPLTDRIIHMVHPARISDPTILDSGEIESFLYAMTDRGLVSIAGMYVMPEADMPGPRIGGCRTQWHEHAGLSGLAVSAGTMNETPEMLHVWTYPGLDPYGHYDGRSTSQLWQPWSFLPSACRQAGDNADACLP